MKFGVRQIANVVFRATSDRTIGSVNFKAGQPVFYLDTAKTSSMEGSATTVYATGGRGNTRLLAWEGEKTLTFNVEDALLSPISFAMLSGAGVIKGAATSTNRVHFHQTTRATISKSGNVQTIDLTGALLKTDKICATAPIYVMAVDGGGDLTGDLLNTPPWTVTNTAEVVDQSTGEVTTPFSAKLTRTNAATLSSSSVIVDYYVIKSDKTVTELQIDAGTFGGYFYVEADTLFRRQSDGKDLPANLTFPLVKIQSNFTFSMSASGDPSTFSFAMDAFPGNTYFNKAKKVLCAIQVADDGVEDVAAEGSVFPHPTGFQIEESIPDSVNGTDNADGTESDQGDS